MRIMLVGDCIVQAETKPTLLLKEVIKSCDLVIGNIETLFHGSSAFPEHYYGQGCPMTSDPCNISTLINYKMHLASHANNHTNDYGVEGLLQSIDSLSRHGIHVAGVGLDSRDASSMRLSVTASGSIGLLASTSSYAHWGSATQTNNFTNGRPGVLGLRAKAKPSLFLCKGIRKTIDKLGVKHDTINRLLAFGDYWLDVEDIWAIMDQIGNERKKFNGLLVYSHHSHKGFPEYAPGFLRHFAHDCIDAGVDIFFSHGTHQLRGIEIYKGKPILYGLGNFISQSQEVSSYPEDYLKKIGMSGRDVISVQHKIRSGIFDKTSWWESIGILIETNNRDLLKVQLLPLDLFGEGRDLGLPKVARDDKASVILERLMILSKKYKTKFEHNSAGLFLAGVS